MLLVEGVIRALPVRHSHDRFVIFLHHESPELRAVTARL
jgi:hypothetical protein